MTIFKVSVFSFFNFNNVEILDTYEIKTSPKSVVYLSSDLNMTILTSEYLLIPDNTLYAFIISCLFGNNINTYKHF